MRLNKYIPSTRSGDQELSASLHPYGSANSESFPFPQYLWFILIVRGNKKTFCKR